MASGRNDGCLVGGPYGARADLLSDASASAAAAREQELAAGAATGSNDRGWRKRLTCAVGVMGAPVDVDRDIRVTRLTGDATMSVIGPGCSPSRSSVAYRIARRRKIHRIASSVAEWGGRIDWPLPIAWRIWAALSNSGRSDPCRSSSMRRAGRSQMPLRSVRRSSGMPVTGPQPSSSTGLTRHATAASKWCSSLERLLNRVHADTEGSGGSRFGLCRRLDAQLHGTSALAPSKRAPRLAVSVIARMAEAFPIDAEAQREWIAERERWVGKVLDRDRLLSETPLLPTLLAVLACQSKDGKLPTSRAEVLNNAVETAARRWEFAARRQGDVELASLKAAESIEALLESFDLISERLIRTSSLTTDDIRPDLSALLSERWGLPQARSAVAANEAIHCWDEAGMHVLGTGQSLSPRLTLFAEIGAARRLSRREPRAQPKQIKQDLENPSFREMLGLSAGLSLRAGNAIVSYLIKSAS